ncbi:hypothetical protein ACFLT4_06885 [Chloroflexota bacterium]
MLKTPLAAKQIRVRLHWANSAEELVEEVNGNLEAHSKHAIYGMNYQVAYVPGEDKELCMKHFMAVFFRP